MFRPRVKLFVQSSLLTNVGGRFVIYFKEPIRNVTNISLSQISIKPFVGIDTYGSIFVRSDMLLLSKNVNMFNNTPQSIMAMVPVISRGVNSSAYYKTDYLDNQKSSPRNIDTAWFELWGDGIAQLNPLDAGWNFCIELELNTDDEQLAGNRLYPRDDRQ